VAVHVYTQTIQKTTQITNNLEECGPCPVFASFTLAWTEEKAQKNLSQGKKNLRQVNKNLSQYTVYILPKHPHITKQYRTTTVQIKTNTVQDIPKW